MIEKVILVDDDDNEIGEAEKIDAHKDGARLHRAFSIYAFNDKGELMLQKRALDKYHGEGLWTNTCCGHPRPGESLEDAARRRLKEEMGLTGPLEKKNKFIYKVELDNGLSEHEYLHIFTVRFEGAPVLNPQEASDWKWVNVKDLEEDIKINADSYTKWFLIAFPKVRGISLKRKKTLKQIKKPADLKGLEIDQLQSLSEEIRKEILTTVSKRGGHLASNLGAVELTMGLHLALDLPKDKIVWDVGHQCYTHKLLTGRQKEFSTLRSYKGMSGFPKINESKYDAANAGHASTSVSVALGLAKARDIKNQENTVVAVIGDGSLTGGLAYEGLNQAGHLGSNLIVVLNDNEMSIDKNVGGLSLYLNRLRNTSKKKREEAEKKLSQIPTIGDLILKTAKGIKAAIKGVAIPGRFFEELGFRYVGPIDGHDPLVVAEAVNLAKEVGGPVLIHAFTLKGRGYLPAEENPGDFHGISAFNLSDEKVESKISTSKKIPSYTDVFGEMMLDLAQKDKNLVAITAAMTKGTGLENFSKKYPKRFFDVGIAEGHAVTFASGLAIAGLKPVVAVYSSFLQRAYDQIIHDVALENLPVIFALDRAGLVGEDGPTHHGVFDLSYLKSIPNMTVMAPSNEQELRNMLLTATKIDGPVAIRFPRGEGVGVALTEPKIIPVGKASILRKGQDVLILAVGRMVESALDAANLLSEKNISTTVVDVRFVKPFDKELFLNLVDKHKLVVTLEENVTGGFAESVSEFMHENKIKTDSLFCHLPDDFVTHGTVKELMSEVGLDSKALYKKIILKINT